MKILKYISIVLVVAGVAVLQSCDTDELHELDIPVVSIDNSKLDPSQLFANAQLELDVSTADVSHRYAHAYVQYYGSTSIVMPGDDYQYEQGQNDNAWRSYTNEIKLLTHVIGLLSEDPAQVNNLAMCRILKVLSFSQLTDLYGDIPYSQAGKAYFEGTFHPIFDTQQSIYTDMLNELDEAAGSFNAGAEIWADADFINGGDVVKWKKFAYSLMLRLAMRVSNADAGMAQTYVTKAIAGGVVTSNDDNILMMHTDGPSSINMASMSLMILDSDSEKYSKLSTKLIDWLYATNDPRIAVFSGGVYRADLEVPNGSAMNDRDVYFNDDNWNWSTDTLHGHPMAVNPIDLFEQTGVGDQKAIQQAFPRAHPSLVKHDAPTVLMTASESTLLTAEAVLKGWTTGDAASLYNEGVTLCMKQWATIFGDPNLEVADADIATYLTGNPFTTAEGEKMIGEQYWLTKFHCGQEAWSNQRRTGYPVLVSQIESVEIPTRMQYPVDAVTKNTDNVNEAIARQGPDTFWSKVWWDK